MTPRRSPAKRPSTPSQAPPVPADPVEGADLALPPRPVPPSNVVAALAAAVDLAWPRPLPEVPTEEEPSYLRWRFSGRWWAKPTVMRRERPWG